MRQDQFEALYSEHAQPLFAFLAYRTGDRALAEDLLSQAFERAYRARGRFDRRRGSEKTWLYAIALNCLRDSARHQASERRLLERLGGGDDHDGGVEAVVARTSVIDALEVLSPEEREAVALRYGADLTVPEIATLLGEKLTTMEGRVYRALRKLAPALGDEG